MAAVSCGVVGSNFCMRVREPYPQPNLSTLSSIAQSLSPQTETPFFPSSESEPNLSNIISPERGKKSQVCHRPILSLGQNFFHIGTQQAHLSSPQSPAPTSHRVSQLIPIPNTCFCHLLLLFFL